jgi:hypothetical protein
VPGLRLLAVDDLTLVGVVHPTALRLIGQDTLRHNARIALPGRLEQGLGEHLHAFVGASPGTGLISERERTLHGIFAGLLTGRRNIPIQGAPCVLQRGPGRRGVLVPERLRSPVGRQRLLVEHSGHLAVRVASGLQLFGTLQGARPIHGHG